MTKDYIQRARYIVLRAHFDAILTRADFSPVALPQWDRRGDER